MEMPQTASMQYKGQLVLTVDQCFLCLTAGGF